jgi:hypothetical protein
MVVFGREVGAPAVLCDGRETSVARSCVVGADNARGIDLNVVVELVIPVEKSCASY